MKELSQLTTVQAIRRLTGIINPEHAVDIIAMVNLIARYMDKDPILEKSFFDEVMAKIGIQIID